MYMQKEQTLISVHTLPRVIIEQPRCGDELRGSSVTQ